MKQISNLLKSISAVQAIQIAAVILTLVFAFAPAAHAQFKTPSECAQTGLPCDTSLSQFIIKIINIALSVAGLIAVLFLIIGGFRYITSAGNEETAEQAKKIITNAIIGIVVIILSFVIVRVISSALANNQV